MKLLFQSLGLDVWKVVVNGYTHSAIDSPTCTIEIILFECNLRDMSAILGGLAGSQFVKVTHSTYPKEIKENLKNVYEGNSKVKGSKTQTYRR